MRHPGMAMPLLFDFIPRNELLFSQLAENVADNDDFGHGS
jgi:hypothetical protein